MEKMVQPMSARERLTRTLGFQSVDRVPLVEWPIRGATMREWLKQGYPEGVSPQDFFDLDCYGVGVPINFGMVPAFEEEILSEGGGYKIWRDNLGAIRKDFVSDENPGFVTRTWLKFAVETREDFLVIKKRYVAADYRYAKNFQCRAKSLAACRAPIHMAIPFLFWTARDWVGFENLCMMFYDDPSLVEEMFSFIADFVIETLRGCEISAIGIDMVELKEDMAYKGAPMISPDMFRRFMAPHYRRLIRFLKDNGVQYVFVDCDGYPGKLIPEWIETGVDAVSPCEIAAGNDLLKLRQAYPTLGLFGGIDKRVLAMGKREIDAEVLGKVPALIEKGGYIPHVDHAVPHDVPLENYIYYHGLLRRVCEGRL